MSFVLALLLAVSAPVINVIDDAGRVRSMNEWRGTPTILAPIYTRCPLACSLIVQGLKRGVAESKSATPGNVRVVLFSFDPRDTPEDLRRFRERHKVPLSWSVARANDPADTRRLLDALGYRFGEAGMIYTHPNEIIVLDAGLRPAKVLLGTTYDIDDALAVARGRTDWLGRYAGWLMALLLFTALLSAIWLTSMVLTSRGAPAPPRPQQG